jgi:hypothetical protein
LTEAKKLRLRQEIHTYVEKRIDASEEKRLNREMIDRNKKDTEEEGREKVTLPFQNKKRLLANNLRLYLLIFFHFFRVRESHFILFNNTTVQRFCENIFFKY